MSSRHAPSYFWCSPSLFSCETGITVPKSCRLSPRAPSQWSAWCNSTSLWVSSHHSSTLRMTKRRSVTQVTSIRRAAHHFSDCLPLTNLGWPGAASAAAASRIPSPTSWLPASKVRRIFCYRSVWLGDPSRHFHESTRSYLLRGRLVELSHDDF